MFKSLIKKIKEQCSKIRRTGAEKEKTNIESKSKYSFFKSRWGIDKFGIAHLKSKDEKGFILELAALFNEVSFGSVFEPYYDSKKHKRYHEHPSCDIKGFVFLGAEYTFEIGADYIPEGMIIWRATDNGPEEIADLNLSKYVRFTQLCPILNTEWLASDIYESIVLVMHGMSKEEQPFHIWRDGGDYYGIDTETQLFLISYDDGLNYYKCTPRGDTWEAQDILNTLEELLPEDTIIKLDWNNRTNYVPCDDCDVYPVVPVSPMDKNGSGSYDMIALLSVGLAEMLERVIRYQ